MADCVSIMSCPFFNGKMATFLPKAADLMKQRLCQGDPSDCARYMVMRRLGREHVPDDLIPNQLNRAKAILDAAE